MFSSSLSGPFVIGSTSWMSAGSVDALDSVANYSKTIIHTIGTRQAQMHGTSKQTTINLSAAAYGVAAGFDDKKCTVDISQEERSETTQHTLTVTAPPHTYTTVYQLVLHCHIRSKGELLPFDIATRDVKIVSYGRGEQRTAPAVEETERAISQWSGQVVCDYCQQPVHVLRLDEGKCVHKGEWHAGYGDCGVVCGMRLGIHHIGHQHWGCCGETNKDEPHCKNNNQHKAGAIRIT